MLISLRIAIISLLLVILAYFLSKYISTLPSRLQPQYFHLPEAPALKGSLSKNIFLQYTHFLFDGNIIGPESIVIVNDTLFTGLLNGSILQITQGEKIKEIARFNISNCASVAHKEPPCARPLGMRLAPNGEDLYVVETYSGVYSVNIKSGRLLRVFPPYKPIGHKQDIVMLNDLVVLPDGSLIVTESSRRFPLHELSYDLMEGIPSGRLYHVNVRTGQSEILTEGLHWPNGVEIDVSSLTENLRGLSVLVCETSALKISRIRVYDSLSPKKSLTRGQAEIWANALPGMPDNIRIRQTIHQTNDRENKVIASTAYWVGMASVRHANLFIDLIGWISDKPQLRGWIAKIFSPRQLLKSIQMSSSGQYGLILGLNTTGHVIESLHDPDGNVRGVSEVAEDSNGNLYLGSYYRPLGILNRDIKKKKVEKKA